LRRTLDAIEARKLKSISKYGPILHVLRKNNARIMKENIERDMAEKQEARQKSLRIDQDFFLGNIELPSPDAIMEEEEADSTPTKPDPA